MKTQSFYKSTWVVLIIFLFLSCSESDKLNDQELTYNERENAFLKEFREKVREEWKVEKMVIAKGYLFDDPKNDSIVINPGTIFINNIYNDPIHPDKYNQLQAYFHINGEIIPFRSTIYSHLTYNTPEPNEVSGLIESDYYIPFPVPNDVFSEEYQFLNRYFLSDNYIMTLSADEKTWTWKGLNRFMREIVLIRTR